MMEHYKLYNPLTRLETYLDSIGPVGSTKRLEAIAGLNLGERSEAAKRVLKRRAYRRDLMAKGLTREEASIIVSTINFN